jgi:hypothetical protein
MVIIKMKRNKPVSEPGDKSNSDEISVLKTVLNSFSKTRLRSTPIPVAIRKTKRLSPQN